MNDFGPRTGPADLTAILVNGLSGDSPAPLLTLEEVLALSQTCRERGLIVQTIEAYAVSANFEDLRMEFSLFGIHRDEQSRPWPELVESHDTCIRTIMAEARASGLNLGFEVWIGDQASFRRQG